MQALLLIAAKSLLLPVFARFMVLEVTGDDMLSRFAFIYSTIPPSTQTYIFAVKYGLPRGHLGAPPRPSVAAAAACAPHCPCWTSQITPVEGTRGRRHVGALVAA